MYTGELNPYNLSKIHLFNGREHLDFWKTDQCNRVQGSDGATYNPYIHEVSKKISRKVIPTYVGKQTVTNMNV